VVAAIVNESSACRKILELAVTAVVFTVSATLTVPVGIATAPSGATAQTAGDVELEQLVAVRYNGEEAETPNAHKPALLLPVILNPEEEFLKIKSGRSR
jgi:hypothetical protein